MKGCARCLCIFNLVLLLTLCGAVFYIIYQDNIEEFLRKNRQRREIKPKDSSLPEVVEQIQKGENDSRIVELENLFAATLGKLLISTPEDILKFFEKSNYGCKEVNQTLKVFKRNYFGQLSEENYYVRLFHMLDKFHQLICEDSEKLRKIFRNLDDDFVRIHDELADCVGKPDWIEKNKTVCVEAQNILDCQYASIGFAMGGNVAHNYNKIFEEVVNAGLSLPCRFKNHPKTLQSFMSGASCLRLSCETAFVVVLSILLVV